MRNLTHRTILAALAIALAAMPLEAQPRSGGGSRGGGSNGGGSRPSSSMSSPSRGGGSSHGSSGRSSYSGGSSRQSYHQSSPSSSSSRSYSQPSHRSSSPSSSRSYSSPQRQGGTYGQQRRSVPQGSASGSGVRQSQQYRQSPQAQSQRRVQPGYQPRQTPQGQAQQRRVQPQQQGSRQVRPQQGAQTRMGQSGVNQRSGQRMTGQPGARPSARPAPGTPRSFAGGAQPTRVHMHPGPGHVDRIHPRHRGPMPFNRPARFWAHGPHYFGYRVGYLPARYELLHYWGRDYYFLDGLYYRYHLHHYYVCRPPFGVFFDPILDDIAYVACNFAYYASVYNAFSTINDNARTITGQNEIIARNNATIAQQNADIALNSERALAAQQTADDLGLVQSYADASVEYFYDDGVFFTKGKDGKYVTIVPPAGALVKELPDDYETITMNGSEYYKVDDTVFRAAVVDGAACFEVLGQLTGALAEQFAGE